MSDWANNIARAIHFDHAVKYNGNQVLPGRDELIEAIAAALRAERASADKRFEELTLEQAAASCTHDTPPTREGDE